MTDVRRSRWLMLAVLIGLGVVGGMFYVGQLGENDAPPGLRLVNASSTEVVIAVDEPGAAAVFGAVAPGASIVIGGCSPSGYVARDGDGRIVARLTAERSCEREEWIIEGAP